MLFGNGKYVPQTWEYARMASQYGFYDWSALLVMVSCYVAIGAFLAVVASFLLVAAGRMPEPGPASIPWASESGA